MPDINIGYRKYMQDIEDKEKELRRIAEEVEEEMPANEFLDGPKDLSFGIKEPLSLVPTILIRKVSRCMEDGAKKRSPYNWRTDKVSARQLLDKILRHTLDCLDGKDLTEDSKLSNLASAAADIAVFLDAQEYGTLVDDRPKK